MGGDGVHDRVVMGLGRAEARLATRAKRVFTLGALDVLSGVERLSASRRCW